MTESDIINELLKIKHNDPKMHLELTDNIDNDSKDYGKKYLFMTLPVTNKTYHKYLK